MVSIIGIAIWGLAIAYLANSLRLLLKNIEVAKQSGIHYIVLPVYPFNRFWLVTHRLWLIPLRKLPSFFTEPWINYMEPDWLWEKEYKPFKELGTDAILLVSPGRSTLFVADAEAISQIVTRRNDFPKPIEIYGSIDLFGKNVVSTEGSIWRHHRKITSPPFTEKNNHLVWSESLHQAKAMLAHWQGESKSENVLRVDELASATMRLSLHVISRAGFGKRILWPHEELEEKGHAGIVPPGHTMTYKDSLGTVLEDLIQLMLLPKWFLSKSPMKANQHAWSALQNWGKYMNDMMNSKKNEIKTGSAREEGMDLMGALVKGAGITKESLASTDPEKGGQLLTDDEILGNAFVFILAGHETTANVLHFSMLHLAMQTASQAHLQRDLDDIFGSRPPSEWDYDRDVPKLFGSMAGAVMNEELRLVPAVVGIPKSVAKDSPQPLIINGKRCTVPGGAQITLDAVAVHRNPKYWPTKCGPDASASEIEHDLASFIPERWLVDSSKHNVSRPGSGAATPTTKTHDAQNHEEEEIGGPQSADTAPSLFHPPRGAYIPFSEGYRACLGRRFAQVEVLAVFAVIFREYSVELAVDEFASDEEVEAMDADARRVVWEKARDSAMMLFTEGMGTILTLQMRKGRVPVRFVKRGAERFAFG